MDFAAFISTVDGYQAMPQLLRLLSRGKPVDLEAFAKTAGDAGADLARTVRAESGSEWDDQGRLIGFGLTPQTTDYRFQVRGKNFYTWCASDTLFFSIIMGQESVVESSCPATGAPIRLAVTPAGVASVSPSEAVVSQRHRRDLVTNLRANVCDHGHFFASATAATEWLVAHPDGQVLSVTDAFSELYAACEELGFLPAELPSR